MHPMPTNKAEKTNDHITAAYQLNISHVKTWQWT